jgi:hypothetical protein
VEVFLFPVEELLHAHLGRDSFGCDFHHITRL